MAKGYSISIASDTKSFLTGVQKGIIDPLEDAAEIIQDLGSESGRDLDKLERALDQAQDETDDVKKAFSDLQKEIRETGRKSRTDFADPAVRNAKRVEDQLDEVTDEAKQNAAEMFSSFDGSFESIADAAQGTLGGLVGGLKGIPAIAAVAAGAAGLGLVSTEIIKQIDRAEELKQSLTDAYRQAAEDGRTFIDQAAVDAAVLDILFDTQKREAAFAEAARIGVDPNSYIRALAGDAGELQNAIDTARVRYGELVDEVNSARGGEAYSPEVQAVGTLLDRLEGVQQQHEDNQAAAERYQDIVREGAADEQSQIERVRSVEQGRWDEAARRYEEAASRGPITVPTELAPPDAESLRRSTQGTFDRRPVKVRAEFVTRDGKVII